MCSSDLPTMALQDLPPQLRTRLRKVEWMVVLFLAGALVVGLVGLGFFIKTTGDQRGWWVKQVPYYTYLRDGSSVKVGTPVKMLGFTIGEVVQIDTAPDDSWHRSEGFNVFVRFLVRDPYQGYIFTDSRLKVSGMPIDIAWIVGRPQPSPRVGSTNASIVLYSRTKSSSEIISVMMQKCGRSARVFR